MIKTLLGKYFWGHLASQLATIGVAWVLHVPGMGWASTTVGVSVGFLHTFGHLVMVGYRKLRDDEKAAVAAVKAMETKV